MRGGAMVCLVATSVMISGCLSPQEGATDLTGVAAGGDAPGDGPGNEGALPEWTAVPVQFPLEDAIETTQTFQGTFEVQNHGHPTADARSAAGAPPENEHAYDVTTLLPRGMPVYVEAEVNADLGEGDLDLWVRAPADAIWTSDFDTPFGGYSKVRYLIAYTTGDPVEVVVRYDELDESVSFDYELRVSVTGEPEAMPPGVPLGVEVPGDANGIRFEITGSTESVLYVWSPADSLVDRVTLNAGTATIPVEDEGEYVVFIAEGGSPARIALLEPTTRFSPESPPQPHTPRVLSQDIRISEPKPAQGDGPYAWTFTANRHPLQAGFFVQGSETGVDFTGSLTSPEGLLFDVEFTGGPWLMPGFGFLTDLGDSRLSPGTYEARVEFGTAAGPTPVQVQDVLVYYAR